MKRFAYLMAVLAAVAVVFSGCARNSGGIPATVATVDGRKITADEYVQELNRNLGEQVLRNMLEQQMIVAWAEEEEVGPTDKQIQAQIAILKREGVYEDKVKEQGEAGLKTELEATQARINLAKKFFEISEDEIKGLYDEANARGKTYVHGPRKQVAAIINMDKEKVEEGYKALKDGMDFDKASSKYSDRMFSMRGPIKGWIAEDQQVGSPELEKAAKKTKKGEFSKVFKMEQPGRPMQYAILKVIDEQPKANLKLKDVKEEIENNVALRKSYMEPEFQEKMTERGKEAKIQIFIPKYEAVAEDFKEPPETPMMPGMGGPATSPERARPEGKAGMREKPAGKK